WIVSPASVEIAAVVGFSTPDDHFAAGPHCRVKYSGSGRLSDAGGRPTIVSWILPPAGVKSASGITSAPDDHFAAGPYCCMKVSGSGGVVGAGGCPTIGAGIVSAAGVQKGGVISAPDDHLAAGPYC